MNIKILKVEAGILVEAHIINGKKYQLPSIQEGWRFNFSKHAKIKDVHCYIVISDETPNIIEGCLIYKMKDQIEPYMAYIEIAPLNKGKHKRYDRVAECLIAFACRLSFTLGKGDYKGWLAFDVHEEKKEDQIKLMSLYSTKYKAQRLTETTMLISPQDGEKLIDKYLPT
jgi:hypothetical protein